MINHIIIIGGGGHALVLADSLLAQGKKILGYTAPHNQGELCNGVSYLGNDNCILGYEKDVIYLANGIGSVSQPIRRKAIYLQLMQQGFRFADTCHPKSTISKLQTRFAAGHQILATATISAGVEIGENTLINSCAVIEHNTHIGNHCHIASGAILCGGCDVADDVHIGAGAILIQEIKIGTGAVIAAGAVVTKNVEPFTMVAGIPAIKKYEIDEHALEKDSN